eukprot:SAG31_NODE_35466_length_323_cov_0.482143_1_plen_34_part_10
MLRELGLDDSHSEAESGSISADEHSGAESIAGQT